MKLSDRCREKARLLDRNVWTHFVTGVPNYNKDVAELRDLLLDAADGLDKHPVL